METDQEILTIKDLAQVLRCFKAHAANVLLGKVAGIPRLTHVNLGRRKLIRRKWLDQWLEANKNR